LLGLLTLLVRGVRAEAEPKAGDIFGTLARRRSLPDLHRAHKPVQPVTRDDIFALSARAATTRPQAAAPEWAKNVIVNPFEQLEKLGAGQIQRTPFDADV